MVELSAPSEAPVILLAATLKLAKVLLVLPVGIKTPELMISDIA